MERDIRVTGIALTLLALLIIGGVVTLLPQSGPLQITDVENASDDAKRVEVIDPRVDPGGHETQAREAELQQRFQQAVAMLHAKQYDYAVKALHRVLELAPQLPEAHVNMGYALIGLEQYKAAADFFNTATELNPMQLNAYYGLGMAYEGLGEYRTALSAMESYIHLANDDDPYLKMAQAASWEWGEMIRIKESGEPAPEVVGRKIGTGELVSKRFGEEPSEQKVEQITEQNQ